MALNAAVSCVRREPHRGQATFLLFAVSVSGIGPGAGAPAGFGGAIPAATSLARPSAVIQSLVHGRSQFRVRTRDVRS